MEEKLTKLEEQVATMAATLTTLTKNTDVMASILVHHNFLKVEKTEELEEDIQVEAPEDGKEA